MTTITQASASPGSDKLTPAKAAQIIAACAEHGLTITDVIQKGVMLELVPASLSGLPDAATLRQLADQIGGDGIRYVTLSLEPRP